MGRSSSRKPKFGAWCVYALYRTFEGLIGLFPLPVVFVAGHALGMAAHYLLPGYRNLARRNLSIAFAGEIDAREIRRLARRHFATLGANMLSSIKLGMMSDEAAAKRLEVEGTENVREVAEKGKGFVYLICHMGNWEMLTRTAKIAAGYGRSSLYQPLSNPYMDAHVRSRRESNGTTLFDRRQGFNAPIKFLRSGGGVGVLVDQHAGDKGVWCPFFGRLASTTNLAALMGLRTGAGMLPIAVYTTGLARWKQVIAPPLEIPGEEEGRHAVENLTAEMNLRLEDLIRESPEDWFWVHNRWKTPWPAFLLNRYKRGMVLPRAMPSDELKPFRILVRSSNWLGDACMAIPAVRAIRRGRADARVTVLAPEKLADVWRIVPEVDEVVVKPDRCSIFKAGRLIREAGDFDVGVLLPNSQRSALEMRRGKVPRIVGYAKGRSRLVHQAVEPLPEPAPPRHHAEHYLHIARTVGGDVENPEIFDEPWARPMGGNGRRLRIGLCPGAEYGEAKRWPLERFGEAARKVAASNGGCEWVVFGTSKEAGMGEELSKMLEGKCRNLVGKTSLHELINELRHCEALLTNDTGTMHLAAFIGVPTISIFGSTEPRWTGPIGDNHRVIRHHVACSPCFLRECPMDFRCMESIEADEVAEAVLETVGRKGSS